MKKILLTALLIAAAAHAEPQATQKDKFLSYKFNELVTITISNVPCPVKQLSKQAPYAAIAFRKDGDRLFGCFTHRGDMVVIHWAGGDKSEFPANVFLIGDQE